MQHEHLWKQDQGCGVPTAQAGRIVVDGGAAVHAAEAHVQLLRARIAAVEAADGLPPMVADWVPRIFPLEDR